VLHEPEIMAVSPCSPLPPGESHLKPH
jgi:hypothetical protein